MIIWNQLSCNSLRRIFPEADFGMDCRKQMPPSGCLCSESLSRMWCRTWRRCSSRWMPSLWACCSFERKCPGTFSSVRLWSATMNTLGSCPALSSGTPTTATSNTWIFSHFYCNITLQWFRECVDIFQKNPPHPNCVDSLPTLLVQLEAPSPLWWECVLHWGGYWIWKIKMTGGTPEVRSNKSLTLLTFDIWYLTFEHLNIWQI